MIKRLPLPLRIPCLMVPLTRKYLHGLEREAFVVGTDRSDIQAEKSSILGGKEK